MGNKTDYKEQKIDVPNENWARIDKQFFLDRVIFLKSILTKDMHYGDKFVVEKNIYLNEKIAEVLR